MSGTVWDYEPDIATPKPGGVDGRVDRPGQPRETAGLGLSVFADLAVKIGNLCDRMDRQQQDFDRKARQIPGNYQYAAAGIYPSSGSLALNLGSPDQGQQWEIRRIVVGGSDITTAPGGVGWLFVQGSNPIAAGANPSVAQAVDFTTAAFPQRAFYGTHQLVVDETEYVWMVITGGTSGTQYVASLKAEVFDMAATTGFVR